MTLAIFDLDNTLIAGDSDARWGEFLVANNLVDESSYLARNDAFFADYRRGELDIEAYLQFALAPLARFTMNELEYMHRQFMRDFIDAIILPKARELVTEHRDQGHTLLVITATNRFVAEPIVQSFGIEELIACEAEIQGNRYTGKPIGVPSYQQGKVQRLNDWLRDKNSSRKEPLSLQNSYFYSDSINDVPLLNKVDHPVAVDPCPQLQTYAANNGIPTISLR